MSDSENSHSRSGSEAENESVEALSSGESLNSSEVPNEGLLGDLAECSMEKNCICLDFQDSPSIKEGLNSLLKHDISFNKVSCFLATIERAFNFIINEESGQLTWRRVLMSDCFYRLRHEYLSKIFALTIGIDFEKTDIPFSDFGIDSERTPDFIVFRGKSYYIFEITVSMNEEKSFLMKGVEEAGFESKYKKEIDMMKRKKLPVEYIVCYFNMKDPEGSNFEKMIETLPDLFYIDNTLLQIMKMVCKGLSRLTHLTREFLAPASSILFSKDLNVKENHPNMKELFDHKDFNVDYSYQDFCISVPVYQKINSIWFRLNSIKDRSIYNDNSKFLPILDVYTNKISFMEHPEGFKTDEFDTIIANNQKQRFFEKLRLRVGNKLEKASISEGGVRYTKKVFGNNKYTKAMEILEISNNHNPTIVAYPVEGNLREELNSYKEKIREHFGSKYYPKYFDDKYEENYINSIKNFDLVNSENLISETFKLPVDTPDCLAKCDTDLIDMEAITQELMGKLRMENSFTVSIPVKIQKMKSSFILPVATVSSKDRCELSFKNTYLINSICEMKIGEYTRAILNKVLSEDYSFHSETPPPSSFLNEKYSERFKLSNAATKIVKNYMKQNKQVKFNRQQLVGEEKEEFNQITLNISNLNKIINEEEKKLGIKKSIGMVRINCNPKTVMGSSFKSEMKHFKEKGVQSTFEGVGLNEKIDMSKILQVEFDNLKETFTINCGPNDDFLIDQNTYDDCKMLKQLKEHTLMTSSKFINQVKDSLLGHSAAFISRMAHSLAFYSQLPFNNSFVRVDNLGYKNCLLIVRGGSKIFKTKSSKLFRLLFPCNKTVQSHYVDNTYGESSFTAINIEGEDYILTPWAMLHENILMDSISFYPRVCTFCVLNSNHENTFVNEISKYFINILLAFHNRRQTESMLANLRYILLSTMGDYSAFNNILPEFIGFNYDKVQAYLRLSIIRNYGDYYKKLKTIQKNDKVNPNLLIKSKLKNIVTGEVIKDTEELALMIYSTFLMTKAPYQRPVERANNLKGILDIQELYNEKVGLNHIGVEQLSRVAVKNEGDYLDYSKKLMENDFKIDPYYCTHLGIFSDSYFRNNVGADAILVEWLKIINKNWDSMATTTGLRGDTQETFWGQKGFFVIYDKILNDMDYKNKIRDLFSGTLTDDEKRKEVRKLNLSYSDTLNTIPETLIYHAVDKRQWRGGREIYVMDLKTKRMQQPIEKFMAYLCKKTDTELISIPSDKRSQVIHHALFEKDLPDKDIMTWFLTFDCSKWAPKSMFVKFALMIIPMNSIPQTFKKHFFNYLELLYSKRLYFNDPEVKVLERNPKFSGQVEEYLISERKKNGYYMIQPYSWVMGIFNYTSSLMHAFNQKYCSYILRETTMESFNEECSLFMFAHSDDSGGRLSVSCKPMLERALFIYEINLKACNHLLSRKKCVVSKIYFEILSIIYMFSQLLALLPKFLGGIRFLPTDKGPAHDMLQSYSKCIELMVAGADFNTAYLYFKFYSAEIWRFYYNKAPIYSDYLRPPQYLGMPDSHPLMVLINGSDSDIIRIIFTKGYEKIIALIRLTKYFDLFESDEGMIKPFKFQVKVRGIKDKFRDSIEMLQEEIQKWSFANVNYGNTVMNSMAFLRKLTDPGFVGALANETEVRRMSRAYYFRSGTSVVTKISNKKLSEVLDLISEVSMIAENPDLSLFINFFGADCINDFKQEIDPSNISNKYIITYFKDVYANSLKLNDYLDRIDFTPSRMRPIIRTLKPTHLQIVKFGKGLNTNFDPTQLVSYIYEPELAWALPNPNNLIVAKEDFDTLMHHLGLNKDMIDASTALKIVRAHQSKSLKEIYMYSCIPGHIRLIKNFSGMLTFLATNSFHNYEIQGLVLKLRGNITQAPLSEMDIDEEAYFINTVLDVIVTIGRFLSLTTINLNKIETLDFPGGDVENLLINLKERQFSDLNFYYYNHYIEYIKLKHILWYAEVKGSIFEKGAFYTYLKEQKFKGNWYGKGTIAFYYCGEWLIMELFNNKVESCIGNLMGKLDRRFSSFINDTLIKNNINPAFTENIMRSYELRENTYMGYDLSGDLTVDTHINMRSGVPYKYQGVVHYFVNDIFDSEIEFVKENLFIAKQSGKMDYKIYTLKIERSEVIPVIRMIIDPDSISSYLVSNAYNDFAEFINQSILVNYGAEYYIPLETLKDNCQGSLLYQLMSDTQMMSPNLMPRHFKTSPLPAPEGSLLRMILNYQDEKNKEIISMPKKLNPSILSIRNEYPESFSVILSEKMNENFENIYDSPERLQLTHEFISAASQNDPNKVRNTMIKLMCYWGYTGLINVIQTYTFNQSNKNHQIFNLESCKSSNINIYSNIYIDLINASFEAMRKTYNPDSNYDYPLGNLFNYNDIESLRVNLLVELVYSCYNYEFPYMNVGLSQIKFNNLIIAIMKDPNYVVKLMEALKDSYPLNTLSFEPKNIKEIMSTYNTLRLVFIECHKINPPYKLDYKRSYQHLRHDVTQPLSMFKDVGLVNLPPGRMKYHCFLNDDLRHEINRPEVTQHAGGIRYIMKQEVSELCDTSIPTSTDFVFEGVITQEYLESDGYDDLSYELITADPDMELIEESIRPYKEMYEATTVKKRGKSIIIPVKWVILPNIEGRSTLNNYMNNTGENVVVLSNCFIKKFEELRNSHVYLVNYSKFEGELPDMLVHVMSSKHVPVHLWDKYIGGKRLNDYEYFRDTCMCDLVRVKNEVKRSDEQGQVIGEKLNTRDLNGKGVELDNKSPLDIWMSLGVTEEEALKQQELRKEMDSVIKDIDDSLNEYVKKGIITKSKCKQMSKKYKEAALHKIGGDKNIILKSFFTEVELLNINEGVKSGDITNEMTSLDHIKMMQAPESFGVAFAHSKPDSKAFKDIRYKAEIDALHANLSDLVSSATLTVSDKMFKVLKSYYNSWRYAAENTKYKRETKKFFLNYFLSLLNSCSKHKSSQHDKMWQEVSNNISLIIGEEPEEEDERDLYYRLPPSNNLRLKYNIVGLD